MSAFTRTRSRFGSALAAGAALLLLITACTAQTAESPTASPESSSSQSEQSSADPEKAFLDWQLKFAECMRGEGVDMPDPTADGSVSTKIPENQEAFEAALATCQEKLGAPPANGGQSDQEILDEQLKTAQCLRDDGYTVEDPQPGGAFGLPNDVTDEDLKSCGLQIGG